MWFYWLEPSVTSGPETLGRRRGREEEQEEVEEEQEKVEEEQEAGSRRSSCWRSSWMGHRPPHLLGQNLRDPQGPSPHAPGEGVMSEGVMSEEVRE